MDNHGGRPLRDDAVDAVGILRGGTIEVYTSHWNNPELGEVDAVMVSISRGRPRWKLPFSYRRYPALAPSDEAWQKEDLGEFEASYTRQLEALGADRILSDLEKIGSGRPVVCLCWERPHEPFCHRWVLASFVERETGTTIPELEAGTLPEREDAAELRLF